jgi:hypothetical protein
MTECGSESRPDLTRPDLTRSFLSACGPWVITHCPAVTTDRARADRRALDTSTHGTGSGKPRRHAHARRLAHDGSKPPLRELIQEDR